MIKGKMISSLIFMRSCFNVRLLGWRKMDWLFFVAFFFHGNFLVDTSISPQQNSLCSDMGVSWFILRSALLVFLYHCSASSLQLHVSITCATVDLTQCESRELFAGKIYVHASPTCSANT
jgi:hypothetical protein